MTNTGGVTHIEKKKQLVWILYGIKIKRAKKKKNYSFDKDSNGSDRLGGN